MNRIFWYILYMPNQTWNDPGSGSELERYIVHHTALKPGDKLEGKIIEVKPNGNLLIHFGEFRAIAEARFPMHEGDKIDVMVVTLKPKLKLKLIFHRLNITAGMEEIINKIEMVPEDRWSNVKSSVQKFLGIEGDVLFPPDLYAILEENKKNVKVKINEPHRLSLLLDTIGMGRIRVDFFLKKKDLNITFYIDGNDIKHIIDSHIQELEKILKNKFRYLVLNAIVSPRKIADFDIEDMDPALLGTKMLDLKI